MGKMLRTAAMVVGAVALIAATAGAAAPGIAGAAGAAGAGGVAGVSAATLTAIGTYGGLAAGALSAIATATAPGLTSQGSQTSFTTNPQSGLPYAMGRTRMSGLRFFADTNTRAGYTKFNDLLWFGALLSIGGQIDSIEKFTADGEEVTFNAATGNANGTYQDYMAQKVHLGGPQAAAINLTLMGSGAPGWTSQHRLSGITHAMWCLRYNKQGEMYGAGAPEPAWIGKWVKVYDPRLDSTYPGGSGPCRVLNESTYVWSQNPGLHALTWALGRWENGQRTCGIGAPVANIRVAEFVECANVCDANAWKVGGVEWTTDSKWDTLKRIMQAGGARPTQTGAMIGCLVSAPRTAIATIESRHLLDGLSIAATKSRRDRFNSVIPRYVDEDSDWAVISGTAVTVPEYVTADKGQRTKEIDYPLVQVFSGENATQPGQLAAYDIVNSREAGPITWTTGPEWIGLKTGDVIYLNVPEEGLVNQPVLITRRAPDPSTGKVSFAAETETHSKHAYALGQSTTPPAPFSLTAPDLKPPAPSATAWAVSGTTSGEGFPALIVTGDSEMPSADAIVIDYRKSADTEWSNSAILSAVEPVTHVIAPLASETAYDVRIGYRVGTIDGAYTIFSGVMTGLGKITIIEGRQDDQDDQIAIIDAYVANMLPRLADAEQAIEDIIDGVVIPDIDDLRDRILAAEGDIATVEATLGGQGAQLIELQTAADTQAGQLVEVETRLETAEGSITETLTLIETVEETVAQVSLDLTAQDARITTNALAIDTVEGQQASLSFDVDALGSSVSGLAIATATLDGNVAQLTNRVSASGANILPNGGLENGFATGVIAQGEFEFINSPDWGPIALNYNNGLRVFVFAPVYGPQIGGNYTFAVDPLAFETSDITCDILCYDAGGALLAASPQHVLGGHFGFENNDQHRGQIASSIMVPTGTHYLLPRVFGTVRSGQPIGFRRAKLENGTQWSRFSPEASVVQQFSALATLTTQYAALDLEVAVAGANAGIALSAINVLENDVNLLFAQATIGVDVGGRWTGLIVNGTPVGGGVDVHGDYFRVTKPGSASKLEWVGDCLRMNNASGVLKGRFGNLA